MYEKWGGAEAAPYMKLYFSREVISMKRQKRQRMMMAILAGLMAALMLLPIVANIFLH